MKAPHLEDSFTLDSFTAFSLVVVDELNDISTNSGLGAGEF
jgi:hypothetical protein